MNNVIEWYNENEMRAYPVSEQATRIARNGMRLPDAAIVDLCIMAPPTTACYVSSVRLTPAYVSVGISTPSSGVLTTTVARSDLKPYTAYPLTSLVDNYTGWIVFGTYSPATLEDYRFTGQQEAAVEPRAIRPVGLLPVQRLYRAAGPVTATATGIVRLVAGQNVTINRVLNSNTVKIGLNPDFARMAAGPCKFAASRKVCGLPPIRSINGVCPDENGILTLRFE